MPGSRKKSRSEPGTAPITPALQAWLSAFEEKDDRIEACKAAGLKWRDVKAALADSREFRALYDDIMEEREVQMVDQFGKAGREGNAAAAKNYLNAVGSRLARSPDDDDGPSAVAAGDARDFAREIFGPAETEVN
jgi:hypothetical protein